MKVLEWHKWEGAENVPMDTELIFEIQGWDGNAYHHIGTFKLDAAKKPLGVIGGKFYFDHNNIIKWAEIGHLL